jgi:hypothetical protein
MRIALMLSLLVMGIANMAYCHSNSPGLEVLVGGAPVPKYFHNGTTYLEAIKGKEYEIRISNPLGVRIAVALAVDGLNTIDARYTEARHGRKWVLDPYETIVISGWQTNSRQARRFFFTTEEQSYGAWLNQTKNLGIISAVFFREKAPAAYSMPILPPPPPMPLKGASPQIRKDEGGANAAGADQVNSEGNVEKAARADAPSEYAATGIGDRIGHEVQSIYLDLEDRPFAMVNLRYEFRPVLVRLGVIPPLISKDPIIRREHARGFRDNAYCPEP